MKKLFDGGVVPPIVAGSCIVVFAVLLFSVVRSFRSSIAEMLESETRVTIVNSDGSVFYDTVEAVDNHASRDEVKAAFSSGYGASLRHSETLDQDLLYCARKVGGKVVRLAIPYTGVIKSEHLAWMGLSAAIALGLCTVLLVFFATRRLSKRLDDQSKRLEIATASEKFRREFTSNITHELKSPLTSIQGAVEILGDGSTLSDDERRDLFDIIRKESARLSSLVGDVLSLARIERDEVNLTRDFTEVDLKEIIEVVAASEEMNANKVHARIAISRNDEAKIEGNVGQLEEVLRNLIENALKYSGSETLEISSTVSQDFVTVTVKDFGLGIPQKHLPHIFERFYRVNKSRSRSLGGTGLGLAIVKHLVQLHGGTVSAASTPGLETAFSFSLPLIRR